MKKFIYTIAAAMTLAACSSEDNMTTGNEPENNLVSMTFTASQEGEAGTRAGLNGAKINWQSGDAISINGAQFTLVSGGGTETGSFIGTTAEAGKYTAVYPYTGKEKYESDGGVSGVVLPSEQTAIAGSFDPKAALMMAVSENKTLEFKNAVGFVKVTPQFDCKKIILRAADYNMPLAGKGVLAYENGEPRIYFPWEEGSERSYTITLSGTITNGNDYYIAVPTISPEDGTSARLSAKWTLTFVSDDDKVYIRQSNSPIEFKRSKAIDLGTFSKEADYWVSGARGIVNPDQEVDLGITTTINFKTYKIIFANRNLTVTGLAKDETDCGDYFAWGAIEPWYTTPTTNFKDFYYSEMPYWREGKKDGYTESNAPFYVSSNSYSKYTSAGDILEPEDDAARVILGGDWQIPSKEVWSALVEAAGYQMSNVELGCDVDVNGKNLFLPLTTFITGNIPLSNYDESYWDGFWSLYYWGNSLENASSAYCFCYKKGEIISHVKDRYVGCCIRPVRLEEVESGSFEDIETENFNWN